LQRKAHNAVHGLYEHNAQDQRELDRLNGQTQLLLHNGATLMDASPTPPLSSSVFTPVASVADVVPDHHPAMTAWDLQGNATPSALSTGLEEVMMTDILHPTIASDMRVLNADLLASTMTGIGAAAEHPWNTIDLGHNTIVRPNTDHSQMWDNTFAPIASAAARHDATTSTHDVHYDNHDPLAFLLNSTTDRLSGSDLGVGVAGFCQPQLDGQATPHGTEHQMAMGHANAYLGLLDQQQQRPMQFSEGSLERAELERAWRGFMEQLELSEM
jgi:hypothetical protein